MTAFIEKELILNHLKSIVEAHKCNEVIIKNIISNIENGLYDWSAE